LNLTNTNAPDTVARFLAMCYTRARIIARAIIERVIPNVAITVTLETLRTPTRASIQKKIDNIDSQ